MSGTEENGPAPPDALREENRRLAGQVEYLAAAARELAAQRDMLGERAANLAGELARRRAVAGPAEEKDSQ